MPVLAGVNVIAPVEHPYRHDGLDVFHDGLDPLDLLRWQVSHDRVRVYFRLTGDDLGYAYADTLDAGQGVLDPRRAVQVDVRDADYVLDLVLGLLLCSGLLRHFRLLLAVLGSCALRPFRL